MKVLDRNAVVGEQRVVISGEVARAQERRPRTLSAQPAVEALERFRCESEPLYERIWSDHCAALTQVDPVAGEMLDAMRPYVNGGGKRIRAALSYLAYQGYGGTNREAMMRVALALELFHGFVLIHDDLIDRAPRRRGEPSITVRIRDSLAERMNTSDPAEIEHNILSISILAGDACHALFYESLADSGFDTERVVRVLRRVNRISRQTVVGELLDVCNSERCLAVVDEERILRMVELKTAVYSIEGPLTIGAELASADEQECLQLAAYARPVGLMYQVFDDLQCLLTAERLGAQMRVSDLENGRHGPVIVLTSNAASREDRERLARILARRVISQDDYRTVVDVIKRSGALARCHELGRRWLDEAQTVLCDLRVARSDGETLASFAFLIYARLEQAIAALSAEEAQDQGASSGAVAGG